MKRILSAAISLLLLTAMALQLTGCAVKIQASDLMEGIEPRNVQTEGLSPSSAAKAADFAVRLLRTANETGRNTLISPLSVMAALAMTANGAGGETLAQMESVLGMTVGELNDFFFNYRKSLVSGEKYKLNLADSIWFTSDKRFTVNRDFLQTNADYYGADAYRAPFDGQTLKDINNWVKEKTDGTIPKILDNIPYDAVMYLINALAFEAEWESIYREDQVREGIFTREDGTKQTVDFMFCEEGRYLEDGKATGFVKAYAGGRYAFAALLPKEGVTLDDYIASLDGPSFLTMLSAPKSASVRTSLPKFETKYDTEMSAVLTAMGMPVAFDSSQADFTGLGTSSAGNIFIGRVIHKTFIRVDEKGTKAGAATLVEMEDESVSFEDGKTVLLDRPFLYLLIDTETGLPFFIGTMTDVKA